MNNYTINDSNISNALQAQNENLEKVMGDNVQYMSSKEIADICEKQHSHVCRDIRRMFEDLGVEISNKIDDPNLDHHQQNFQVIYDSRNYIQEYLLDKNLSLTLVAGYNTVLRNRIINRWLQLEQKEQQQTMPNIDNVLSNPNALRGILFNYVERVIALENNAKQREAYISDIEPQAEAFEKIGNTDETFTITQASKILDVDRKFLIKFLETERWIYRQNGKLTPMKDKQGQKLIMVKFHELGNGYSHTYITSKGLQKITLLITQKFPSLNFRKYERSE